MIALCKETVEKVAKEIEDGDVQTELESAIARSENGHKVIEFDLNGQDGPISKDLKIAPEVCEAIGGHCWDVHERKHVTNVQPERECCHCGKEQYLKPEQWVEL